MSDGKVEIAVNMQTTGVSKGVSTIKNKLMSLKGASGGANKSIMAMGAVAGIASSVASKAMSVLSNSVGSATSRFDTMNQYPKVMQKLGYSTKDAKSAIDIMAKGIEGLPTSLPEITKMGQQFAILTGSASKGAKTAVALNNAFLSSGASAADASRGVQQYSQMLAAGKVDMQSWRTLQETMPVALKKTAEAFGFTGKSATQDLYKALQDGSITMDQLNDKFLELNDGANGFASTAKSSSEGIGTSFQNMQNAVVKGLGDMIKAIDDGLKSAGIQGGIAEVFDGVKNTIVNAFKVINEHVKNFVEFIAKNKDWVLPLAVGLGSVIGLFTALVGAIKGVIAVGKGIGLILGAGPWMLVAIAIAGVVSALVFFFTKTETGKKIWKGFCDFLKNAWQAIVDFFSGAVDAIGNVFKGIGDFFSNLGQLISDGLQAYMNFWAGVRDVVFNAVTSVLSTIGEFVGNIFNSAVELFTSFVNGIVSVVGTIISTVISIGTKIITSIVSFVGQMISGGAKLIGGLVQGIASLIGNVISTIVRIGSNIISSVVSFVGQMISGGAKLISGLINGISSLIGNVASTVSNGVQSAISAVGGIVGEFYNVGVNIIKGIVNGIKSMGNAIANTVKNMAKGAIDGVKHMLGIHSPSRVFRDQVGKFVSLGFAEGISKYSDKAVNKAELMAQKVASIRIAPNFDTGELGGFNVAKNIKSNQRYNNDADNKPQSVNTANVTINNTMQADPRPSEQARVFKNTMRQMGYDLAF